MPFVDTHVHFHFPDFDSDRAEAIARSKASGVTTFINVGTDVESSRKSMSLAEADTAFYATAGIHPHDAKDATPEALNEIERLLHHPRMVAIGEVGLDFFRNLSPAEKQIEVLRSFFAMQRRTGKPLVIHCRDAYEKLIEMVMEELKPPVSGVMHCYSSDKAVMSRLIDLGFYISFAGPLTYKKNDALREACAACPLERLLFETDAPFLAPQRMRGKRNESAYLLETAKVAADLHGISIDELGEKTTVNARKLFRL